MKTNPHNHDLNLMQLKLFFYLLLLYEENDLKLSFKLTKHKSNNRRNHSAECSV